MPNIYRVEFQVVNFAAQGKAGPVYKYRKPTRTALVSAANEQAVQTILNADIPVGGGELIELLHVSSINIGTEGIAFLS